MIISIAFDGTLVDDSHDYEDLQTPLQLRPGAKEAVCALKRAGHTLVLTSTRANRALREDWRLNPLWKQGLIPFRLERWEQSLPLNQARYQQMLEFISATLPDIFACIDDGAQGKVSADVYLDARSLRYGEQVGWNLIKHSYGKE